MATMDPFTFPPIYDFPPFFTQQPNLQTWNSQLQQWIDLILKYCKHYKIWSLSLDGLPISTSGELPTSVLQSTLFTNNKINKRLKNNVVIEIFQHLQDHQLGEFIDRRNIHEGMLIYWKKPEEWASTVLEYIDKTGQNGSVLTLYELQKSDATNGELFHNLNTTILLKAIDILVRKGKASVLKDDGGSIAGIKTV